MKKNTKLLTLHIVPKAALFALALANCIFIWSHRRVQIGEGISFCVYCPWYDNWSFGNEPSILFLASVLLLISKRWSYLIAGTISGSSRFTAYFLQ
jgi:hypothetical protein